MGKMQEAINHVRNHPEETRRFTEEEGQEVTVYETDYHVLVPKLILGAFAIAGAVSVFMHLQCFLGH